MKRVKFVKGNVVYIYKRRRYLESPEKGYVSKILYNEENNTSYVYIRRYNPTIDVILSIAISIVFLLNFVGFRANENLLYNTVISYYDNTIYLGIELEENSLFDCDVTLYCDDTKVDERLLHPGDIWISQEYYNSFNKCYITVEYLFPLFPQEETISLYLMEVEDETLDNTGQ